MTETPSVDDPTLLAAMRSALESLPIHDFVGLEIIEAGMDGRAVVEIPLDPNSHGGTGQLHGGVIAMLFDVACAVAATGSAAYDHEQHALVTADLHVRYLGTARGERVRAEAEVVKAGRTLVVVEGRMVDSESRLVAVADFSAMLVPRRVS